MATDRRRWGRRLGQLVLVGLVTWALYRALGLSFAELDVAALARWRPDPWGVTLSAVVLVSVYFVHALLWRRIASDLTGTRPSVRAALRIYFLANLGRYLPGKVWQVAGYAALASQAGLSASVALTAAALGQFFFLFTGVVAMTMLLPGRTGAGPALAASGALLALGAGVFVVSATRFGARLRGWAGRRFGEPAESLFEVVARVRARDAAVWCAGYAGGWVLLGGAFALFSAAFVPEAAARPAFVAGTLAASYVSGYIAVFAPAGVGVREGVMGVLLGQVMPAPAALVVSVASRAWFTVTEIVPLALLPFLREGLRPSDETRSILGVL